MKNNLQNLTDEQRRKILAAAEIVDGGDMAVLKKIIEFDDTVNEFGNKIDVTISEVKTKIDDTVNNAKQEIENIKQEVATTLSEVEDGETPSEEELIALIKPLIPKVENGKTPTKKELLSLIEPLIPVIENINQDDVVSEVLGKIELPKYKETILDDAGQIRDKLETLKEEDRLDASAIKNLPQFIEQSPIPNGGGWRNLFQLHDVSIASPTNNQVLKYNSTTRLWEAGTASGGSTTFIGLTDVPATYTGQALKVVRVNAGETSLEFTTLAGGGDALKADPLSQFASTTSLQLAGVISDETGSGALVFGTSPSITSPTFGTSITASYATLSTVPYFDASKNLVSSSVTPTELGYLSGVTSAIQTQLNAKGTVTTVSVVTANGISGSVATDTTTPAITLTLGSITPSAIQVSGLTASEIVGTDASKNLVSLAVATYPSLTELTYLKGVTSAIQTQINTKANSSGALTQFVGNGNWKVWYSDGSGDVQELALGADGTFLKSNGAAIAPSFATPSGSGDVSKVGTPVNNQVGVWTGDGTIEGDTALTFDTTTDTLATTLITATTVTAALVGNASTATALANARTIGGVSFDGTANIVPQTIQSVNEATDTTCFPLFISASGSQSLQPLNNAGFIYNSNTNALTATTFIGALTGTASGNLVSGGALGTPSSGTGTNITGIPAANILAGSFGAGAYVISTSLQVATLELGHATDTTITRVSAGLIAVEGITVVDVSTAQTLTNKTMIASTNVIEEITTTASSSTPTPTGGSLRNFFTITALAAGATFAAPSGTPADGNYLTIRILDNGTARSLAWNAIYRDGYTGYVTLPTTTILGKTMYVGFRYNGADSKWDLVSVQIMS